MSYTGWLLPDHDRARLLRKFPPSYPMVIAHHVTLTMGEVALPTETSAVVVGQADDDGVQALVVQINGTMHRPDGETYHITWSLDPERKPVDSLTAVKAGWEKVWPVYVSLVPMFFD